MNCIACGCEITKARMDAMPKATLCTECLEGRGDAEPLRGVMIWEHKTAPTCHIGPKKQIDELLRHSRRGVRAQLPLSRKTGGSSGLRLKNPKDELVPLREKARCHPLRDRVSPDGKCLECVMKWYSSRFGTKTKNK